MAIITSPQDFNTDDLFVDLEPVVGSALYLKVEGLNFAGSVKLKAASAMVEAAEADGTLTPGTTAVAISPDLGERYMDTIYQSHWVEDLYGDDITDDTTDDRTPAVALAA